MQIPKERQKANGNAKEEKKVRIMVQTSHLGYVKLQMAFCRSLAEQIDKAICDEAEQVILPKKRKKRKKGFDREIIRVKDRQPAYRQLDPLFKQRPHAQHGTSRKNRI